MRTIFVFIITSLIGSFIYLGIGWLVFDVFLGTYSNEYTTQLPGFKKTSDFSITFLYVSCLAYAVLITYITALTLDTKSAFHAFLQAACIGLLIACMTDFYWYASSNFYTHVIAVFVDLVGATITVGILGLFTHLILKKIK